MAPTALYTLSLHDALPISPSLQPEGPDQVVDVRAREVESAVGVDHVPALRLEGVVQEADLEAAGRVLEGGCPLRLGRDGGLREEVRPLHLLRVCARRPDDRRLDRVLELPDVSGPLRRLG